MTIKLDKYEQEIEDNFQGQKSVINTTQLELLKSASVRHLKSKKSITIRVTNHDLEAIKIKASKMGLAYQTYINMLIHQAASKI
ncbi:MAG: CopG family antitoxin [Rickettsiaceae bacterium]|nr:CopG family antitoxin [Rickettsiaceae bacterium]